MVGNEALNLDLSILLSASLRNKKGFAVPHNGIIFSENSEKNSNH